MIQSLTPRIICTHYSSSVGQLPLNRNVSFVECIVLLIQINYLKDKLHTCLLFVLTTLHAAIRFLNTEFTVLSFESEEVKISMHCHLAWINLDLADTDNK